jgi:hypothetical protein
MTLPSLRGRSRSSGTAWQVAVRLARTECPSLHTVMRTFAEFVTMREGLWLNSAGKVVLRSARLIVTEHSSSGWRKTSRVLRLNSGISSRNKTPLWARLILLGCGVVPPPTGRRR